MKFAAFFISLVASMMLVQYAHAQSACHTIKSGDSVMTGYGVPYDVTSSAKQLLISVSCNTATQQATMSVGTNADVQYIYKQGYLWGGSNWQLFDLSGSNLQGNAWYVGSAQATFNVPPALLQQNNYLVAYVCTWTGTAWKCGCRDNTCATPSWQLQTFTLATGGSSSGGSSNGGSTTVIRPMQGNEEALVSDLDTPWDLAFLPDGNLLVTERKGTIIHVDSNNTKTVTTIPNVLEDQESGMHGITLHPNFSQNQYVYVYYLKNGTGNRVERYTFNSSTKKLEQPTVILDNIPSAKWHDGGRIRFGPDGYLYVATGDATNEANAQQTGALEGKILRITDTGAAAPGNPFNNRTYSYGHRNPQGLTWDGAGRLWSAEHGPSNAETGCDEVNHIQPGKNYGWPTIRCEQTRAGMERAVHQTGKGNTWAPSGIAYHDGSLFVAGLRGSTLYELQMNGTSITSIKEHFKNKYGRLRAVSMGPDGNLYFSTSNRDGRGSPKTGDDKIIRVKPDSI